MTLLQVGLLLGLAGCSRGTPGPGDGHEPGLAGPVATGPQVAPQGSTLPRATFMAAGLTTGLEAPSPAPFVEEGEQRMALTLANGESVRVRLDGGQLENGDLLAFDARRLPGTEGDSAIQADLLLSSPAAGAAPPAGAPRLQYRLPVGAGWTTPTMTLTSASREITLTATGSVLVGSPRVQRRSGGPGAAPTVLLITSDTHRADHVSSIDPLSPVATEHIDALAGQGALFSNCFSSTNVTNPSHIALMTGVHPRDTKIVGNDMPLHESAETLAEQFRRAGYQTFAAMSAFHLYDELSGLGQGFDRMNTTEGFARDGRETLAIMDGWLADAEGAPLFLWLHLFDPHAPYRVPDAIEQRLLDGRPDPRRPDVALPVDADHTPGWVKAAGYTDAEHVTRLYGGGVEYLDGLLGPFLQHGRLAEATVAFTSDHGEGLGEQQVWWDHSGVYGPTLHVPLVLRGPGLEPGTRCNERVRQIDVGRTLLNMAGLGDVEFPGVDLRLTLADAPPSEPRFALSANAASASIESDGWLLELFLREDAVPSSGRVHALGATYLYDLERDPSCERDVLRRQFERARAMRSALVAWLDDAQATGLHPYNYEPTQEQEDKLKQLGYATSREHYLRWWAPELRDPDWTTRPWCRAFADGGDAEALSELDSEAR